MFQNNEIGSNYYISGIFYIIEYISFLEKLLKLILNESNIQKYVYHQNCIEAIC